MMTHGASDWGRIPRENNWPRGLIDFDTHAHAPLSGGPIASHVILSSR